MYVSQWFCSLITLERGRKVTHSYCLKHLGEEGVLGTGRTVVDEGLCG